MQRKEGLPSARGQREKGDRLCHVITPRDKARALKEINKKASASYERREFSTKKQDATKPEMKRRAGAGKKRNYARGANAEKRRGEG